MSIRIGVLAIQGDVVENICSLEDSARELGEDAIVCTVKTLEDIEKLDGLVIPGGESTVIGKMSLANGSLEKIRQRAGSGMPVLGICAGMVLVANRTSEKTVGRIKQPLLDLLDIDLERNSFGRQKQSFEAEISMDSIGIPSFNGVFIRAPVITSAAPDIETVAKLNEKIVAVKKKNIIGVSFHPELTCDLAVHRYFVSLVGNLRRQSC